MSSEKPDMIESLQLSTNPKDYFWMSQGVTKVDGMNDKEEFDLTHVSSLLFLKKKTMLSVYNKFKIKILIRKTIKLFVTDE